MTKQEFDSKYVGEKTVVHCPTGELAKEFLDKVDEFGYKWYNGERYTCKCYYSDYKENTCYNIFNGSFAYKDFYLSEGFNVVDFNDSLKNGDIKQIVNHSSKKAETKND